MTFYPGSLYITAGFIAFGLYKRVGYSAIIEVLYMHNRNDITYSWSPYYVNAEIVAT